MAKKASLTKAQQTARAIHEAGRLAGYEEGLRDGLAVVEIKCVRSIADLRELAALVQRQRGAK